MFDVPGEDSCKERLNVAAPIPGASPPHFVRTCQMPLATRSCHRKRGLRSRSTSITAAHLFGAEWKLRASTRDIRVPRGHATSAKRSRSPRGTPRSRATLHRGMERGLFSLIRSCFSPSYGEKHLYCFAPCREPRSSRGTAPPPTALGRAPFHFSRALSCSSLLISCWRSFSW